MIHPQISSEEQSHLTDLRQTSQNLDIRFLAEILQRILNAIENYNDYLREQAELQ